MTSIAPCEVYYSSYRVLEGGGIQLGYDRCAVALAVRQALDPRDPLGAVARRAIAQPPPFIAQPPPFQPIAHPPPRQPPAPIAPVLIFAPPYVGSQAEEKAAGAAESK